MYRTAEFQGRSSLRLDRAVSTLVIIARCAAFVLFITFAGDVVALIARVFGEAVRLAFNAMNTIWGVVTFASVLLVLVSAAGLALWNLCLRACAQCADFIMTHTHRRVRQVAHVGVLGLGTYAACNWHLTTPSLESSVAAVCTAFAFYAFAVYPLFVAFLRLCRRLDEIRRTVFQKRGETDVRVSPLIEVNAMTSESVGPLTRGPHLVQRAA